MGENQIRQAQMCEGKENDVLEEIGLYCFARVLLADYHRFPFSLKYDLLISAGDERGGVVVFNN